ncbi:MAG: HAD family phosphatase [Deltaproteobacteria bacterium]|nr:HAD family phosphatase [Deltaproteobacteria bacterium]
MAQNLATSVAPITAVAFDLGNVLIRVDHGRFCQRLAEAAGVSSVEIFDAVFNSGLEPQFDTGRLSSEEFYREVCRLFGINPPFPLFAQWWQDVFDPMEGMAEVVAELAGLYPLFLVSNTNELHFDYIYRRFPLLRHVGRFILSYRVGSRKPEPAIYLRLIREIARPPEQCLYIDDKAPFVEAARRHGLQAWQFISPADFISRLERYGLYKSAK